MPRANEIFQRAILGTRAWSAAARYSSSGVVRRQPNSVPLLG